MTFTPADGDTSKAKKWTVFDYPKEGGIGMVSEPLGIAPNRVAPVGDPLKQLSKFIRF